MHSVTRAVGALMGAVAVTAATLPAQATEKEVTVEDRLAEISLVDDAVPVGQSPLDRVTGDGRVNLHAAGSSAVSLNLPVDGASEVAQVDGRYVVPASEDVSFAVAPTSTGTQILVGIESAQAPASYRFDLDAPPGFTPKIAPDGGVDVVNDDGESAAQVEAPWAVDAEGRHVPTRFKVVDGAITQVVDHRAGGFAYPIVADPSVKFCSFYTAVCVKFTQKETRKLAGVFLVSISSAVGTVCGLIPAKNPAGVAVKAICAAAVTAYFYTLRKVFLKAKKQKKCAELKFRIVGPPIVTGKVVKC